MSSLPRESEAEELLGLVRQWVDKLAADRYEQAFELIPGEVDHWTPALARKVVSNYGSPEPREDGRTFRVTPVKEAQIRDSQPRHEVTFYDRNSKRDGAKIGDVHFDLPLDGYWSDLTALFSIWKNNEIVILKLEDIHVL